MLLEFQTGHWLRVVGCAAASLLSWIAFLKIYRFRVLAQGSSEENRKC